jgi:hypothetical protein
MTTSIDLLHFTANELKSLINTQLPLFKGYKKKRKDLLIEIILQNNLDLSSLKFPVKLPEPVISNIVYFD